MQRYILGRFFQAIVCLFALTLVVFLAVRLTGDPTMMMLPPQATDEDFAHMRRLLGLDQPLYVQYQIFITNAIRGDFGTSSRARRPAMDLVLERLPATIKLASVAMLIALVIAVPIGVLSAVRRDSLLDNVGKAIAVTGQAMPTFWLGIILIVIFAVQFRVLPSFGTGGPEHYVLPAVTLGWHAVAGLMRLVRSGMLDVLDSEYIKLARIKGLSEGVVVWTHALKNACIPALTFAGLTFAEFLNGSVVTETVFAWPGVGRLAVESVVWRDFPAIQAVIMFVGTLYLVANLAVDILYAYVDPRIRYT